jgi:hypothetical protein
MSTTFDETLFDPFYSDVADGGPEWATAIVRAGQGGAIAHRGVSREDFISRYEINFKLLSKERRLALRKFAILRNGMARGFRFLAPDIQEIESETVGVLNSDTGEIDLLTSTDGSTDRFFVVQNLEDDANSYLRWHVKPSPVDDFDISIALVSDPGTPVASGTFTGVANQFPVYRVINLGGSFGKVALLYRLGILLFETNVPSGHVITLSGKVHIPVAFTEDWQKFSVDQGGTSEFKAPLEELLPVEIGIRPSMSLPTVEFSATENLVVVGGVQVVVGGVNVVVS